jgi:transposase
MKPSRFVGSYRLTVRRPYECIYASTSGRAEIAGRRQNLKDVVAYVASCPGTARHYSSQRCQKDRDRNLYAVTHAHHPYQNQAHTIAGNELAADSRHNRKAIFNAGLIPNINENPRNRKTPKRGRKRLFNAAIHSLRLCVERTFAWEDKFKRLLLRFEFKQQRHYGMKLMAYTMINLRRFCGA